MSLYPFTGCRKINISWEITFFDGFWASGGRIWTIIGGNQTDAFPDLPIQPQTLDIQKQSQTCEKTHPKKFADIFFTRDMFKSP